MQTRASQREAFGVLADLKGYSAWLPRSLAYGSTTAAGTSSSGTGYVEATGFGRLSGTVLEEEPDRRLVFDQSTRRGRLQIRITYVLTPTADGTRIDRTGIITTRGAARPFHRIIVALIRRENARTLRYLREHLDRSTTTTHQEES